MPNNEANVWQPRIILEVSADTKRVTQRFTATAGQTLFLITDFAYVVGTGALQILRQNADLSLAGTRALSPSIEFVEQTDTTFALTTAAIAGEQILAIGYVGITGNVDVRDTDIFVTNYQAIRDYAGTEITLYSQGKTTIGDGGEDFFQLLTGAAPGFFVDNNDNTIVPTGGDGSTGWIRPHNTFSNFNILDDFKASTTVQIGDIIGTAGSIVEGDGGDNSYKAVPAGTGTADNGSLIDLLTHQAEALFPKGIRRLKQWSVVGDGVADDTTAILAALAFVGGLSPEGGVLIAGNGKFKFTGQLDIPSRVTLIGEGLGHAASTATSNAPTIFFKSGNFDGIRLAAYSQLKGCQVLGQVGNSGGDGVVLRGRGALIQEVASTGHGSKGIRVGDSSGTNTNLWRATNIICRDNGSHGFYVHDGGGGAPDVNVGILNTYEARSNGGDGLAIENSIDCTFIGVETFENTGHGVRLYSGAKGHMIINPYNEDNVAGVGQIDSGAFRNYILGRNSGSGQWTINDQNNYFLGNGDQPFLETLMRINGIIHNGPSSQDYKQDVVSGVMRTQGSDSSANYVEQFFTQDGDGTDSILKEIYALGTPGATSNRERMVYGWDSANSEFVIKSNANGSGTDRPIRIQTGDSGSNEILFEQNDLVFNLPEGIGDAGNSTMQAPAKGTGGGPSNLIAVKWIRVKVEGDGQRYFIPLFQ